MLTANIRIGAKLYSDVERFPYGFKKSGDFSIAEATILSTLGLTLRDLESGLLKPKSTDEEHFVQVTRGLAEPVTKVERTWQKYVRLTRSKRNFFTLHSSNVREDSDEEGDEFEESDLGIAV